MERLLTVLDRITDAGAWVAVTGCALLALLLLVEVAATSVFGFSQPYAVEYSSYLAVVTLFAGSGYALRSGSHIRVAALFAMLSTRHARVLDAACTAFALGVAALVAAGLIEQSYRSYSLSSVSYFPMATPLWIPQSGLAGGFIVLALSLFARLLRIVTGRPLPDDGVAQAEL